MFKPNPSTFRAIPRSFRGPQFLNTRRTLHAQAQKAYLTNGQRAAVAVTGSLIGVVAYQMFGMRNDIYAEALLLAPQEKQSKINVQHIQVQSSLENPGVYAWGVNRHVFLSPHPQRMEY